MGRGGAHRRSHRLSLENGITDALPHDNQATTLHRKFPGAPGQLLFLPSHGPQTTQVQTRRPLALRSTGHLHPKKGHLVLISPPVPSARNCLNPMTAEVHLSGHGVLPMTPKMLPGGEIARPATLGMLPAGQKTRPMTRKVHPGARFVVPASRGKLPDGSILLPATPKLHPASHGEHLGRQLLVLEMPWMQSLGAILPVKQFPLRT